MFFLLFSVFSKINDIQTHTKSKVSTSLEKSSLFSLLLFYVFPLDLKDQLLKSSVKKKLAKAHLYF